MFTGWKSGAHLTYGIERFFPGKRNATSTSGNEMSNLVRSRCTHLLLQKVNMRELWLVKIRWAHDRDLV